MKRSILGSYLAPILYNTDSAPGLSVTGDAALDTAVMERLGMEMESAAPAKKENEEGRKAGTESETPEKKAEREAAEAEDTRISGLVESTGKTKEEILAEEAATAETAAQEKETAITTRMEESGQSREEVVAAMEAEAAQAVQTPELTPEVKTWVDAQIAAKDEEITTLKTQAEEAQSRVTELEAQVQAGGEQAVSVAPIDALFLIDDPSKLDVKAGELRQFEAWLLKNWDGVAAVEAGADGKTPAHAGYTAEQIRERYAHVKELRESVLPAAREGIKVRKAHEAQARRAYPELFDAKRPEYKVAESVLKAAPGLKVVIPNIHIVIGDALRGEKLRLAEEKARASKGKLAAGKVTPPKIPAKPAPGGIRPNTAVSKPADKAEIVNAGKFSKAMEAGASGREALVAALS